MLILWFKSSASCQFEDCAADDGTASTFNDGELAIEPLRMLVAVQIADISGILEFVPVIGKPKPRFPKFEYQT
ncbi:hypothetical protein K7X08_035095 [Anisodus acutangulus]|uniref:Uncharacterized protein n=1 Tax=Anisodus acutangulus TaxID=402998 RepID=A0A9Q1LGY2_9SOLA|nr:hypothetical protein K7X08_035095 [Anisodus acutangulus]